MGFLLVNGKSPVRVEQGAFHELGEGKGFARCEVHGYGNRFGGGFHAFYCETRKPAVYGPSAFVSKPFPFAKRRAGLYSYGNGQFGISCCRVLLRSNCVPAGPERQEYQRTLV